MEDEIPDWMRDIAGPPKTRPLYYDPPDDLELSAFLNRVCEFKGLVIDLKPVLPILNANGIIDVSGVKAVGVDMLPFLGMPEELAGAVGDAISNKLVIGEEEYVEVIEEKEDP